MKNKLNRFLTVTLFVALAATPHGAESKVMVMAALDNPALATSESQAATSVGDASNAPAVASESREASTDNPKVRIDHSGIHVGGRNPVDIDVPSIRHRTGEKVDLVGLMGVVFGCTIPIAIVAIVFYFRHRRLKMHHETIRAMIEKGMPIPPEMAAATRGETVIVDNWTGPEGSAQQPSARRDFRAGLILVAVGAALLMIVGKVGWILVFIGAARLIFWLVEDRKPRV